jgi:hypothetical protein
MYEEPVPADLNTEDEWVFNLSLRQLILIGGGLVFWFGAAQVILSNMIGLNILFAMLATIWIPGLAAALAFVTISGRPLDLWAGQKLAFLYGKRTYLLTHKPQQRDVIDRDLNAADDAATWVEQQYDGPRVLPSPQLRKELPSRMPPQQ